MLQGVFFHPGHARQGSQCGLVQRFCSDQGDRLVITRAAFQLQRRAVGQQLAVGDHHRASAHGRDLFEDVGGDDDYLVVGQALDQPAHLVFLIRVEAVGGLVENQHLGVMHNRLGQADAALKAFRQGFDALLQHRFQFDLSHRLGHPFTLLRTLEAAYFRDKLEEAAHRHIAVARRAFGQVTDLPLGLEAVFLDIETEDTG